MNGVAVITNYTPNPSYEIFTTPTALYNGATITRQAAAYADSGSYVARVTKGTAGSTLVFMIYPITWTATDGVEIDSVMITNTFTIGAFRYGDSPNWLWNGTANNSTSTGSPQ